MQSQPLSAPLQEVRAKLWQRSPAGRPAGMPEAGVLVGVLAKPQPSLIYTVRSSGLSSHAGEVAFPGGKRDRSDADLWETALRESSEEIGLEIGGVERIGQLDRIISRFGIEVTPCVALVSQQRAWDLSSPEIDEVFAVSIERLLHEPPTSMDVFSRDDHEIHIPRWRGEGGQEIWGLTARITAEFLRRACGDERQLCRPEIPLR